MRELRGKLIADRIKEECLDFVNERNGEMPVVAIIRVGENPDDISYEKSAKKKLTDFGLEVKTYDLEADITNEMFMEVFDFINKDPEINGILVLRPLPSHIDEQAVVANIDPKKDLDGISPFNTAKVMAGDASGFAPCTAQAVVELLKAYDIDMTGKDAVIVGRSMTVGKPLSMLLLKENATVTVCHSKTEHLAEICAQADILVAAIGKPRFITGDFVKKDAVVIDVGINVDENGALCGDCDWDSICEKASAATPVPGGVGAVTTALLGQHLLRAAKQQEG